jgi:hypothetical protein
MASKPTFTSRHWLAVASPLVALLLPAVTSTTLAAGSDQQYHVRNLDNVETCTELNRAVVTAKKQDNWQALYAFSLYTMGYITAINRMAYDTYDIGGSKNSKTMMVWLEQYCAEHPRDSFDQALYHLTIELYPVRLSTKPK